MKNVFRISVWVLLAIFGMSGVAKGQLRANTARAHQEAFERRSNVQNEAPLLQILGTDGNILTHLMVFLTEEDIARFSQVGSIHPDFVSIEEDALDRQAEAILHRELAKIHFIELPPITSQDLLDFHEALAINRSIIGFATEIREPLAAFRIADQVTPIGLYYSVMREYPEGADQEVIRRWRRNPSLPATLTTTAEDVAFAHRLSEITGRQFYIPSEMELEYAIRGRVVAENGFGPIMATLHFFLDGNVAAHAWLESNSGGQPHGVAEVPAGARLEDFKNTFQLIHPLGNVFQRSREGVLRGGSYDCFGPWFVQSSFRDPGFSETRSRSIGFRLAEAL